MKLLLAEGTRVTIHSTTDPMLDGTQGMVRGVVADFGVVGTIYIIETETYRISDRYPYSCLGLTESCLTEIS